MTELTSEEVKKILKEASEKPVVPDSSEPIVPKEIIEDNTRKGGEVWKKTEKDETPKE